MSYTLDKTMDEIWEAACAGRVIVLKYFGSQEAFELDEPMTVSQQIKINKFFDENIYSLYDSGFDLMFSGAANEYGTSEQQK